MRKYSNFLFTILTLIALTTVAATTAIWQPPKVDSSLVGTGTPEDPIGVDYYKYRAKLTQASTNAPTATVLHNELLDEDGAAAGNGTYSYTGVGVYTWTVSDAGFNTASTYVTTSVGNATGLVLAGYAATDSTIIIKCFNAAGEAANLAGTAYVEVAQPK